MLGWRGIGRRRVLEGNEVLENKLNRSGVDWEERGGGGEADPQEEIEQRG
jgi:hypothetical protein